MGDGSGVQDLMKSNHWSIILKSKYGTFFEKKKTAFKPQLKSETELVKRIHEATAASQ